MHHHPPVGSDEAIVEAALAGDGPCPVGWVKITDISWSDGAP